MTHQQEEMEWGYKKEVFLNKSDRSGWEDGWVEKPFKGLLTTVKIKLLKFIKTKKGAEQNMNT